MVRNILYIGIPSALENSLFQLGRVLVVSMISLFGTVHISANAVANNLDGIGCIVGQAMGLAMITVVGRCVGAGDLDQRALHAQAAFVGLYRAGRRQCADLYLCAAAAQPLHPLGRDARAGHAAGADPCRLCGPAVARGLCAAQRPARRQRRALHHADLGALDGVLRRLGFSYILCVQMGMGAVGVWIAMVVDWVCRVTCFAARFLCGAWRKKALST